MFNYFGGSIIGWPQPVVSSIDNRDIYGESKHAYSLCLVHGPKKLEETYSNRQSATSRMYEICDKYGMQIVKVYNDKHDKSYFTDTGAEFHINRMF